MCAGSYARHWGIMNKTDLFLSSQNSHIAGIIDIMLVVTGTLSTAKKLLEKKEQFSLLLYSIL